MDGRDTGDGRDPGPKAVKGPMRQHVIDPEMCIHCMSCMPACPRSAITERGGVMAIDPELCDNGGRCLAECSTGAIETWIAVDEASGGPWSVEEQLTWERLPGPALV